LKKRRDNDGFSQEKKNDERANARGMKVYIRGGNKVISKQCAGPGDMAGHTGLVQSSLSGGETPVLPVHGYLLGHAWQVFMYRTPVLCQTLHTWALLHLGGRSCVDVMETSNQNFISKIQEESCGIDLTTRGYD
jgi:hypothetical protein